MKHEEFKSLELDDVLTRIMDYIQGKTQATAVHWISAYGLMRVHESPDEQWRWAFATADVIGQHLWSRPATDSFALYQLWRQVDRLLPYPWNASMAPHWLPGSTPRFVLPIAFDDKFLGVMTLDAPKETNPVALLASIRDGLDIGVRYLSFAYTFMAAKNESFQDELTSLYNQKFLPIALDHEVGRSKRDGTKFSLLFLDIDYFKMVNDGRGHWVGSRLLVELSKVLRSQVRSCDYCFRYGGDEFIVLLGSAGPDEAVIVAERIRHAIEQNTFTVEGHSLNLTVSIGLASYPDHAQTATGLIQIADQAMYYGKRKSRNIVFVAS